MQNLALAMLVVEMSHLHESKLVAAKKSGGL